MGKQDETKSVLKGDDYEDIMPTQAHMNDVLINVVSKWKPFYESLLDKNGNLECMTIVNVIKLVLEKKENYAFDMLKDLIESKKKDFKEDLMHLVLKGIKDSFKFHNTNKHNYKTF